MGTGYPDGLRLSILQGDVNAATHYDGLVHLGYLVTLWKIRVKIVFAVKNRSGANTGAYAKPESDGLRIHSFVDDG